MMPRQSVCDSMMNGQNCLILILSWYYVRKYILSIHVMQLEIRLQVGLQLYQMMAASHVFYTCHVLLLQVYNS